MSRRVIPVLTSMLLASCQPHATPAQVREQAAAPVAVPDGPDYPRAQAVWEALLRGYMAHTVRSEGDITLQANRMTRIGEQRERADVALMARLGSESNAYNRLWLAGLVSRGLVNAVCAAASAELCPARVMTSFLSFSDPQFIGDTVAVVRIADRALNPSTCGRGRHGSPGTGGEMTVQVTLLNSAGAWTVARGEVQSGSTIIC